MLTLKDVESVLANLSKTRPIFHSEADFQFEFACEIKNMFPLATIRLMKPAHRLTGKGFVDITVEIMGKITGIELAYKKKAFYNIVSKELYNLIFDNRATETYGYIMDINRDIDALNILKREKGIDNGFAILLTSLPSLQSISIWGIWSVYSRVMDSRCIIHDYQYTIVEIDKYTKPRKVEYQMEVLNNIIKNMHSNKVRLFKHKECNNIDNSVMTVVKRDEELLYIRIDITINDEIKKIYRILRGKKYYYLYDIDGLEKQIITPCS